MVWTYDSTFACWRRSNSSTWNQPRCVPSPARCGMERCSSPSVLSKKPSTTTWNDSLLGCRKRSAPGKGGETNLAPVCPCVRFWGPGRGTTPAKQQTRPVGGVWASCGRAGPTQERRYPAPPPLGGGAGYRLSFGLLGLPCSSTTGSHGSNKACLGPRWCRFPTPLSNRP